MADSVVSKLRVPKDALREQLVLAANRIIRLQYEADWLRWDTENGRLWRSAPWQRFLRWVRR